MNTSSIEFIKERDGWCVFGAGVGLARCIVEHELWDSDSSPELFPDAEPLV